MNFFFGFGNPGLPMPIPPNLTTLFSRFSNPLAWTLWDSSFPPLSFSLPFLFLSPLFRSSWLIISFSFTCLTGHQALFWFGWHVVCILLILFLISFDSVYKINPWLIIRDFCLATPNHMVGCFYKVILWHEPSIVLIISFTTLHIVRG